MKQKRLRQSVSPRPRLRWRWRACLVMGLVLAAGFGGWRFWQARTPPPPVVNTNGFDPLIAEAVVKARSAVLSAPRSAAARGQMGMVLLAHEIRVPASQCFLQAATLAPREPRWPYFLGLAQLVDNPVAAATNLDRAVRLFPESESGPRLRLAAVLLNLGHLKEAEAHYRHVLQHANQSAPANLGLGKVAIARERTDEAAGFLDAATDHASTRKAAYRLLLNVHQRLGRTVQAEQDARLLAQLPDDEPFPDPFFTEIEQLKTGEKVWLDLADEWIKADRSADALPLLEKTVRAYPKSDRAYFFLGRARLRLNDSAGAEAALSHAVQLAPDSVEAQMQLGVLRLGQRRIKAAQPCFRAAIQAKPNLGEAWYNLGLTLGSDVNRTASTACFREAIRLKPNLVEAYLGLAVVLRTDGQNQAAADELRRALELEPEEPLRSKLLEQLKLTGAP